MNGPSARKGSNWKPLLLIPAVVFLAKGVSRGRARWDAAGFGPGGQGHGPGDHGFGGRRGMGEGRDFRLPPRLESMLDAWHTRAHDQGGPSESTTV